MTSVHEHYRHHLGRVYGWMIGDFGDAVEAARGDLRAAGLVSGAGRIAVDLGAGLGTHAIALAEAGYAVTAIDSCEELLNQLRLHGDTRITCVDDDLMGWRRHAANAEVVLCMGDTLTHLPSHESVSELFETIAGGLGPGGVFLATFRDYSSGILPGVIRFIPVRTEHNRIMTCVLAYGHSTVTVHDVIHERTETGWTRDASSYSKLRLSPEWARKTLEGLGLVAMLEAGAKGMVRLIASRPTGLDPTNAPPRP